MKFRSPPSGCETRPARGEPARAGSEPCDGLRQRGRRSVGTRACEPWGCGLENYFIPDAEGSVFPEGDDGLSVKLLEEKQGRGGVVSGGVLDHGAHEEGGPVTREALASPREFPVGRRAGDPFPKSVRLQAHALAAETIGRTSACPRR
jgi:hypothetical protein